MFGAAASALDRLPDGTRVAVFGDQWIYPAFGDRYHLVSRVDVVAVVHLPHPGRSPEWPQQHRALERLGARLLHRDGAVAIWRLSRLAK